MEAGSGALIRAAEPGDREAIVDLMWALNRFEEAIAADRDVTRDGADRCHAHNEAAVLEQGGAILVAEREARVVGFAVLVIETAPPFVREDLRRHGYVRELVVAEGERGAGIGRLLLAEAERLTASWGLPHLGLGVLVGNGRAAALYERLGFRPHAIEMLKALRPPPA